MKNHSFLAELIARLFLKKNPEFFDYLQILLLVLGTASAALDYLQRHGVSLPGWLSVVGSTMVQVAAFVALLVAELPNQDPVSETPVANQPATHETA